MKCNTFINMLIWIAVFFLGMVIYISVNVSLDSYETVKESERLLDSLPDRPHYSIDSLLQPLKRIPHYDNK